MVDDRVKLLAKFIEPLRVEPGSKVKLAKDFDPGYKDDVLKKKAGAGLLAAGVELLRSTRPGWPPRTPGASSSACRRWTPAARTARSATS